MKKLLISFYTIVLLSVQVFSQDYLSLMQTGKVYFNNQKYFLAFDQFDQASEVATSDLQKKDSKLWKSNCLKNIQKLQKETEQKNQAYEAELKTSKAVLNVIYFYDEKIAMAYKDGKYGYIGKNGNLIIDYKYDEAGNFDAVTGFARVSMNKMDYLIDTTGKEYQLAVSTKALSGDIEALDLSKSHLTVLPKEIFNYPNLKVLIISNNSVSALPAEISRLRELKYLDATGNNLLSLPKEIGLLKNLRFISLKNNSISKLPTEISNLQSLEKLDISNNQLFEFPKALASIYELKVLILDGNKLNDLSPDIGFLINLKHLSVQNNTLTRIPVEIGRLSRLQTLCLSGNRINDLPAETGRLMSLVTFNISKNQISYISPEIRQLNQLKHLDISGNSLSMDKKNLIKSWLPDCEIEY